VRVWVAGASDLPKGCIAQRDNCRLFCLEGRATSPFPVQRLLDNFFDPITVAFYRWTYYPSREIIHKRYHSPITTTRLLPTNLYLYPYWQFVSDVSFELCHSVAFSTVWFSGSLPLTRYESGLTP
jgi:hypothetical protein